jgi:hypothetical protein
MIKNYVKENSGALEQLKQLINTTWDGDLISKSERNKLREQGLVTSCEGFNVVTAEGLKRLTELRLIHE